MIHEKEIRQIVEQVYTTAIQDIEGVRANKKGYRVRYDEVPEQASRLIFKLVTEEVYRQVRSELQSARGQK